MKRTVLTSVILSTLSVMALPASAAEDVRLVITPKVRTIVANGVVQKAAPETKGCISAPNGAGEWCIRAHSPQSVTAKSLQKSPNMEVITVDGLGYTAKEVAKIMSDDGRFGRVEADLQVKQTGEAIPNDEDFQYVQKKYFGRSAESVTGMNVTDAWGDSDYFNDGQTIDVWIMDSSFFDNADVIFKGGASFTTTALEKGGDRQVPHADFRPNPSSVEQGLCNGHGIGVAGVVAAQINNEMAGAGISNNVNLYGGRVMTCGTGYLSDSVNNIEYLLGKEFEGIEPYTGQPGIINLSIGALAEEGCPEYAQEPITRAVEAGWVIVASAGNETMQAAHSTPANCEGVISVGSVDETGELTWFSNYGDGLDFVTQGENIAAPCDVGESQNACLWEGTSFSSPLVAGLATAIKSMTGAQPSLIKQALSVTARASVLGASCDGNACGAGIPDLKSAIAFAEAVMNGDMNTISYALGESDTCEQSWLLDHFGASIPMCELYKATFFGGVNADNGYFELVKIPAGQSWSLEEMEVVTTIETGVAYLQNIDADTYSYGVRMCGNNGECSDISVMDTENAKEENRPVACN